MKQGSLRGKKKNLIWVEICRYLKKRLNGTYATVVDVGAGYIDFINNFDTVSRVEL